MTLILGRPDDGDYSQTKIHTFHDGRVHSLAGVYANNSSQLKTDADVIRFAKENNLTISFGRYR